MFPPGQAGLLYFAPALSMAVSSLLGVVVLALPHLPLRPVERSHRRSLIVVQVLIFVCAAANLRVAPPVLRQAPDYLVLAFLCVTLYFRERLAFIDLLVKRGVFFALGLILLGLWLASFGISLYGAALLAIVFWVLGPAVYARIDRLVDSLWLRRPYSPADAERHFIRVIQAAASEKELSGFAVRSLEAIFRAEVRVQFTPTVIPEDAAAADGSLAEALRFNRSDVSIVVSPRPDGIPFWSDDRRLLRSLAGALGVVLENVRYREEQRLQTEREEQLRLLASRAELKALRAQINPHFLFNALSAIAGLVQDRPEFAAETIAELAQVFRYALRKSETEWVPLADEVEFVSAYLHVEQARFGERLQFELQIDPAAARFPVPAVSIQPLIENAIRHGIADKKEGGLVRLRAALEGDCVSVEVFDTGPGFPPEFSFEHSAEGHGLRNVLERLRGYYGDAACLRWENTSGGTRVVLTFPQPGPCGVVRRDSSDSRSDRR
jgi:signal transduction histidine kinase